MKRETKVIVSIIALVLIPMWFIGLQGEPPSEEVEIDQTVSDIRPLGGIIDTPNKLSPSQVGVIVWAALFVLIGVITWVHRFMNRAVRPTSSGDDIEDAPSWPWLRTENRWIVKYYQESATDDGVIVTGALTVLTIVFAALFTGEYFTLSRTQFFGLYATGMFLSLAGLTVAYYAWFLPHMEVAENRKHE